MKKNNVLVQRRSSVLGKRISELALKAIIGELSTSPKPGLVDRYNCGSHKDMNYFMFVKSGFVVAQFFEEIVEIGKEFKGENLTDLFVLIRPLGVKAEEEMFIATGGINTHKGIIFLMFILCAAIGYLSKTYEYQDRINNIINGKKQADVVSISGEICHVASKMVKGITENELNVLLLKKDLDVENLTHGEKLFLEYQSTGIRGEVESGFKSVLTYGLPIISQNRDVLCRDKLFVQTIFSLMSHVDDTNILHRHDHKVLTEVQEKSRAFLDNGGVFQTNGMELVKIIDQHFINKNISPGGCADLLAVTIFLALLDGMID
jgi:triphosphoribosyl-dephospho-CoA synthase